MSQPSYIKLNELLDHPRLHLLAIARSGSPLLVRSTGEADYDLAILRAEDYLALLPSAGSAPTKDELLAAGQAARRIVSADLFDRQWSWLGIAATRLHDALLRRDLAEVVEQAAWLMIEVLSFRGEQASSAAISQVVRQFGLDWQQLGRLAEELAAKLDDQQLVERLTRLVSDLQWQPPAASPPPHERANLSESLSQLQAALALNAGPDTLLAPAAAALDAIRDYLIGGVHDASRPADRLRCDRAPPRGGLG